MLAAAKSAWIAVLAAVWLDQIAGALWRALSSPQTALPQRWRGAPNRAAVIAGALLAALLIMSAQSVNDVLSNWRNNRSGTGDERLSGSARRWRTCAASTPANFSPCRRPASSATSRSTRKRNPHDLRQPGLPTTAAHADHRNAGRDEFPPPYALGLSSVSISTRCCGAGFEPMPGQPGLFGENILWTTRPSRHTCSPSAPTRSPGGRRRLDARITHAVETFAHKFDTIEATVGGPRGRFGAGGAGSGMQAGWSASTARRRRSSRSAA
ncbi:MAG: hypothetical protein U0521_05065 [Anaerolineae bacterium]